MNSFLWSKHGFAVAHIMAIIISMPPTNKESYNIGEGNPHVEVVMAKLSSLEELGKIACRADVASDDKERTDLCSMPLDGMRIWLDESEINLLSLILCIVSKICFL